MMTARHSITAALCSLAFLAACGAGEKPDAGGEGDAGTSVASGTPAAGAGGGAVFSTDPLTPEDGRKVIVVQLETDAQGNNKFNPARFEAHQGDVIRFTLKSGVHNVHFVADSNRAGSGYPSQPSDMLQLPGQTLDLKVNWKEGKYFFQCDPHALLGMVGWLEVED